jgi:DNA replication licensing factor MCM6
MLIRGDGLADDQGQGLQDNSKVVYVLHPNCPVEDIV